MRYLPTILVLFGLFAFACAQIEEPCTDDGCPDFYKEGDDNIVIPEPTEDIRGSLEYEKYIVPVVTTTSKDEFVYSLNSCITHLYQDVPIEKQIPRELIIAQAALETGWGTSRFANEGNNLFGIRTFDKDSKWLLPIGWDQNKWIGWGVKVYDNKCDSVKDYIRIINTVFAYENFREVRENGGDVYELVDTLDKYATKQTYTELVKKVIMYNIEGVYEL